MKSPDGTTTGLVQKLMTETKPQFLNTGGLT